MIAHYTFPNDIMPDITFNPSVELDSFTNIYKSTWNATWPNQQTVTMTAQNNMVWAKTPQIEIRASGIAEYPTVTLNSDNTVATFSYSMPRSNKTIYVTVSDIVLQEPIPTIDNAFLTYYCVDDKILYDLSQVIIYTSSASDRGIVDLTPYITSLRQYPFKLPSSDITKAILLGANDTGIQSALISQAHYEIDLGSVTLPSTNNNSNDFNVSLMLILPFIGTVNIDAMRYALQTINIKYDVDLTTGLFTATLTVDNIITDIYTGKIGKEAPYKTSANDTLSNLVNVDIQDNYPLQASITIMYHANYDNALTTDNKRNIINTFIGNGFTQFADIVLTDNIPSILQTEIISLLSQGVII